MVVARPKLLAGERCGFGADSPGDGIAFHGARVKMRWAVMIKDSANGVPTTTVCCLAHPARLEALGRFARRQASSADHIDEQPSVSTEKVAAQGGWSRRIGDCRPLCQRRWLSLVRL